MVNIHAYDNTHGMYVSVYHDICVECHKHVNELQV